VEKVWSGSITGTESGEVTIAFGRPVRAEGGPTRGFFIVAFHAARLVEGLPLSPPPDSDITFIDERGQLLHSTVRPDLAAGQRTVTVAPGVSEALQGRIARVMGAQTPLPGEARYGAFVPLARTGWVVGFTRPQAALDARLRARFLQDAGAVGVVFVLAAVLLALVARRVSAPLRRLSIAARAIAVGEHPTIPAGDRGEEDDEVGRLAAAMRAMAGAVSEREERLRAIAAENARLYEEAQAAVRLREEFLSIAAHELKTPLTSVRGSAQLALRRFERDGSLEADRTVTALRLIDSQAARLSALIDRLLDVSRLRSGKLALELGTCDLAALVRGVAERAQTNTTRHTVVVRAPMKLEVELDALRIEQVATNLLDNAIKYSPDGGAVEVGVALEGSAVRLSVRDHGTGIPTEHLSRVFERFFQSHNASHLSGMGLGLFVAREIVELHGGTISAQLPAGGGTLIEVLLPARVDRKHAVPLSWEQTGALHT
jgi:signal transduction histidine kinase